jgi:hypothetical protein
VAVGGRASFIYSTDDWAAWESADGRTWKEVEGPPSSEDVISIYRLIALPDRAIVTGSTTDERRVWSLSPVDR